MTKTKVKTPKKPKAIEPVPRPRIRNLGIRRVRVADIEDAPWNYRTHPENQQAALSGVIGELGFYGYPDAWEPEPGRVMLCDGHLRKSLLLKEYGPDSEIEVNVTDFSEAEAKKATATKDPLAGMAESDTAKLDALLREVNTGSEALAKMLEQLGKDAGCEWAKTGEIVEDEVPEPPVGPVTKPGDLWILGEHRLLCGDSTKPEDVARVMNGERADACIADPPYGISHDTDYRRFSGGLHESRNYDAPIRGDDQPFDPDPLMDFAAVVLWGFNCFSNRLPTGSLLIWCKRRESQLGTFMSDCEVAWMKGGHGCYLFNHVWNGHDRESERGQHLHPTQKPVALVAWAIEKSKAGSLIFDPYAGSGTTLIAAEQLSRRCFAIEISPAYCDVCVTRFETLTGKKVELSA